MSTSASSSPATAAADEQTSLLLRKRGVDDDDDGHAEENTKKPLPPSHPSTFRLEGERKYPATTATGGTTHKHEKKQSKTDDVVHIRPRRPSTFVLDSDRKLDRKRDKSTFHLRPDGYDDEVPTPRVTKTRVGGGVGGGKRGVSEHRKVDDGGKGGEVAFQKGHHRRGRADGQYQSVDISDGSGTDLLGNGGNKLREALKNGPRAAASGAGPNKARKERKLERKAKRERKRRRKQAKLFAGKMLVVTVYSTLLAYTAMVTFGPLSLMFRDRDEWCPLKFLDGDGGDGNDGDDEEEYPNPDYITDPCFHARLPALFWLTLEECDLSRRMLASVLFGGAIGYERRSSDRPAGIRTMGLVSLGACFFTISSQLAFKSSTMGWDSSRVTAAIPTGVGFLGAGLIWKGTIGVGDEEVHQVHGLTTAASLWLSAAIGVGSGGALYFVTAYSTILVIMVLRFGPKLYFQDDASYNEEDEEEEEGVGFDTDEDLSDHPFTSDDIDESNRENESDEEQEGDRMRPSFATDGSLTRSIAFEARDEEIKREEGLHPNGSTTQEETALLQPWKVKSGVVDQMQRQSTAREGDRVAFAGEGVAGDDDARSLATFESDYFYGSLPSVAVERLRASIRANGDSSALENVLAGDRAQEVPRGSIRVMFADADLPSRTPPDQMTPPESHAADLQSPTKSALIRERSPDQRLKKRKSTRFSVHS